MKVTICKCDRCGRTMEPSALCPVLDTSFGADTFHAEDLCQKCEVRVRALLHMIALPDPEVADSMRRPAPLSAANKQEGHDADPAAA